ncbi:MAG: NYN domain-containing protein [Candidatus Shapirobacteria bacterium]
MNKKNKIYTLKKKEKIWAFIDGQNLNLGTLKDIPNKSYKGWKLDFLKFRVYLFNKFRVNKAYLFIGYDPNNKKLYEYLKNCGYDMIYKPTVKDIHGKLKGNVDGELILQSSAIDFNNYDKAIIVAGDGDYRCLLKYLKSKNKLFKLIIPNQKSESSLLKIFQKYKVFIQSEKEKLIKIDEKIISRQKK